MSQPYPTVVTPARAVVAVLLVAAVASVVAARRPAGTAPFPQSANRFVVTYDLLQEDLAAAPTLDAGLDVLEAGVASLHEELDAMRASHADVRGAASGSGTELLAAAEALVSALDGYGADIRRGDLSAARHRLADEDRARAAYDSAASDLG